MAFDASVTPPLPQYEALGLFTCSLTPTAAVDVDPALASTEEFEDKNPLSCHRVRIANRATDMFFSAMCGLDIADE